MRSHKDLDAWKLSRALVTRVYAVTRTFPEAEAWGLTGQMRRAAVSIPSNIAEGAARGSRREFSRF